MLAEDQMTLRVSGREKVLAVGLLLWLSGFWWWSDATTHRLSLLPLVLPGVILYRRVLVTLLKEWWVRIALVLLGFQWLSRFWSDGTNEAHGYWLDAIFMVILLAALLLVARSSLLQRWVLPGLGIVAGLAAFYSLLVFYIDASHNVADDRMRNMLVYEGGLNPVLTGLLCSFGGLLVVGRSMEEGGKRWPWLAVLVILVLGILATQSRGPMLSFGLGFAVLALSGRKKILPAFVVSAVTALVYFGLLVWLKSGEEATRDLLGRGSTGRFEIYGWYFTHMAGMEGLIGKGMGSLSSISADEFGWLVHHPHSVYVTQYYLSGSVGAGLMLLTLGVGLQGATELAKRGEALWMAMLVGFGVALAFDGSVVFSVFSTGRIEPLLLVLPAAIAVQRAGSLSQE